MATVRNTNENVLRVLDGILNGGPQTDSITVTGIGSLHGGGAPMPSLTKDDAATLLKIVNSVEGPQTDAMKNLGSLLREAEFAQNTYLMDKSGHQMGISAEERRAEILQAIRHDLHASVAKLDNPASRQHDHAGNEITVANVNTVAAAQKTQQQAREFQQGLQQREEQEIEPTLRALKQVSGLDWHYDSNGGYYANTQGMSSRQVDQAVHKLNAMSEELVARAGNTQQARDAYTVSRSEYGGVSIGDGMNVPDSKEIVNYAQQHGSHQQSRGFDYGGMDPTALASAQTDLHNERDYSGHSRQEVGQQQNTRGRSGGRNG